MSGGISTVPEQGQLVQVRHRHYLVQDVWPGAVDPSQPPMLRVRLEALDDDQVGETLDVIWEHEVNTKVHDALGLPRPDFWDPPDRFEAFLLATRWSLSSVIDGLPLQAPFRGAIQIEDYQLEPVVRALRMPRVNLLIADDVGLGKTIEAGMVMQELLARQRIRRILVVCPASLQRQWAEEMHSKFALRFEIVDRAYTQRLRQEYGTHVNPWASYPRLITSMDFLKREASLSSFLASLRKDRTGGMRDWDLLVVDESHNVAPTGRTSYVRDSDRTVMMRQILGHFEHRLFLTATPHNGFTASFTAMLEMLDPLRFNRSLTVNKEQLKTVMVRRLKDDMVDALGRRRFPKRTVDPLPTVKLTPAEQQMLKGLDEYMQLRLARAGRLDTLPVKFALTLLKKRLLSSPLAFYNSIQVHRTHINAAEEPTEEAAKVVKSYQERLSEDFSDDEEKDRTEETAQTEAAAFFRVTDEELRKVEGRQTLTRKLRRERWWRYAETAPNLYRAIAPLERVLVCPLVTKYLSFALVPKGQVFMHKLCVFATDRFSSFLILQSSFHVTWAWQFSSTMKTNLNYSPSDCFETFPFPQNISPAQQSTLDEIGEAYHEHRRQLMLAHSEGLTKTYNRFHDPACKDPGILKLRDLHVAMDNAVRDAYGWHELSLDHDWIKTMTTEEKKDKKTGKVRTFEKVDWRFTISERARQEVLRRLLALNHKIYQDEVAAGLFGRTKKKAKVATKQAPDLRPDRDAPLQPEMEDDDLPLFRAARATKPEKVSKP